MTSHFRTLLTSLLSRLWSGRIISRRWLWNDRSWNLLHLGHLNFTVRLRHSLSEVFFAENSWGKIGSSTFLLGADQRLSGEGVCNGIYYCSLGFIASPADAWRTPKNVCGGGYGIQGPVHLHTVHETCYLLFWLRAPILCITNSSAQIMEGDVFMPDNLFKKIVTLFSHKVCRLLSSCVVLRKFTTVIMF